MRTSFHHQPEAQHPNFPLSASWQADYPIFGGECVARPLRCAAKAQLSNPSLWDLACSSSLSLPCQLFLLSRPEHGRIIHPITGS